MYILYCIIQNQQIIQIQIQVGGGPIFAFFFFFFFKKSLREIWLRLDVWIRLETKKNIARLGGFYFHADV